MKRWFRLVIGAACLLGVAGCSHLEGYLDIAREKGMSAEYLTVLKQWTRSQIVYSQFETRVHISATHRSPEFKEAYLQEYARLYNLGDGEKKARQEIQAALEADFDEFIFYAYIPEKTSNDFDRRGSIWSIFLINGKGERIDPVDVRRIEPVTPVVTEFFPYVNPYYGIPYHLRFPPLAKSGSAAGPVKLVFASVIGKVEMEFGGR
ncbi:MAG: hypothetical protein KJ814_01075 [Proteobacteria bacterium]|nr:hypothetical protein [Pseudomonadota bacterium]